MGYWACDSQWEKASQWPDQFTACIYPLTRYGAKALQGVEGFRLYSWHMNMLRLGYLKKTTTHDWILTKNWKQPHLELSFIMEKICTQHSDFWVFFRLSAFLIPSIGGRIWWSLHPTPCRIWRTAREALLLRVNQNKCLTDCSDLLQHERIFHQRPSPKDCHPGSLDVLELAVWYLLQPISNHLQTVFIIHCMSQLKLVVSGPLNAGSSTHYYWYQAP